MTYKFTLTLLEGEPIIEEGDMGSFSDLLVKIKQPFAHFLFIHRDVTWTRASIEFIQE
jgi:hypothetical protein